METCENCGDKVGDLETPCLWNDRVVCAVCHVKLSQHSRAAPVDYASPPLTEISRVQTIEQTAKKWKGQMLLAALLAITGTIVTCAGGAGHGPASPLGFVMFPLGFVMLLGGLIWFIIARIGAWWEHG